MADDQESVGWLVEGCMDSNDHDLPPELAEVARRVRAERPDPSPLELDALRRRVHRRGAGTATTRRSLMKSRVTITMMLMLGVLSSTTGAGLAVSGISGSGGASAAQYKQDNDSDDVVGQTSQGNGDGGVAGQTSQGGGDGGVAGQTSQGGGDGGVAGPASQGGGDGGVAGETGADPGEVMGSAPAAGDRAEAAVSEPEQLAATGDGGDELPFTGFLAVPMLIGGVALLASGVVLRRHSGDDPAE